MGERIFSGENRIFSCQWFFPAPLKNEKGEILPAPEEAILKKEELKETWLAKKVFPQGIPCVSLSPVIFNGQTGYQVRAEIFVSGEEKN
jgi:hypothetical protein